MNPRHKSFVNSHFNLYFFFLFAVLGPATQPSDAQQSPDDPASWRHSRVWTTEDGLPQNWITTLAQRPNGELWAGASNGLARFEGVGFRGFSPGELSGLGSLSIRSLKIDGPGRMWAITEAGEIYVADDDTAFHLVGQGPPDRPLRELFFHPTGKAGFFDQVGGFEELSSEAWLSEDLPLEASGAEPAPDDPFLIEPLSRTVHRWTATGLKPLRLPDGQPIRGLFKPQIDRQRILHVAWTHEIQRFAINGESARRLNPIPVPEGVAGILLDASGALWISLKDRGLARLFEEEFRIVHADVPEGRLWQDREGSLWLMAHEGLGLWQFLPPTTFLTQTREQGLPRDTVWTSLEDSTGTLWVGTSEGLAKRSKDSFETIEGTEDLSVYSLAEDPSGDLWLGSNQGLFRLGRAGLVKMELESARNPSVRGEILPTASGIVWVSARDGLYRLDVTTGMATRMVEGPGHGKINRLRGLHLDRQGRLWIATEGKGIFRLEGSTIQPVEIPGFDGTGWQFWEDDDGSLWLLTRGRGLVRIDGGPFAWVDPSKGLFDDSVHHMTADSLGRLWLTSDRGVFRIERDDLIAVADGEASGLTSTVFGLDDGLNDVECNSGYPGIGRLDDGRLTIPTMSGLAWVDPARVVTAEAQPGILILDARPKRRQSEAAGAASHAKIMGRQSIQNGILRLDPQRRDLEIDYSALTYVAPKSVRYRYRLKGFDDGWIDAGTRRTAVYTHLPSGRYTFEVQATTGDGAQSTEPATLEVIAPPQWHEPLWVHLGLGSFLMGSIWWMGRRRLTRRHARELRRLMEERARLLRAQEETAPAPVVADLPSSEVRETGAAAEQPNEDPGAALPSSEPTYALVAQEVEVESEEDLFIRRVQEVVESELHRNDFGVFQLAEAVHLSRRQLHRKLVALTGETPAAMLRRIRLERAAQLLEAGAGSVAHVAGSVGYTKPSHFSERFKQVYGQSPSAWAGSA